MQYFKEKRVILIGASASHIVFLKNFKKNKIPGLDLVLVEKSPKVVYSGMVSGYMAGIYDFENINIDLWKLCQLAGARLLIDKVIDIDINKKTIDLATHPPLSYDAASIATGLKTKNYPHHKNAFIWPIYPLYKLKTKLDNIKEHLKNNKLTIISFVGYNQTTFECCMALKYGLSNYMANKNKDNLIFQIISSRPFLANQPAKLYLKMMQILATNNIKVITASKIEKINSSHLIIDNNKQITSNINIVCEVEFNSFFDIVKQPAGKTLANQPILVDEYLKVIGMPAVFASGSVSAGQKTESNSGVKSVRQGKLLSYNIKALLYNKPLKKYRVRNNHLAILNTADGKAIFIKKNLFFHARWCMILKNWIDKRYIQSTRANKKLKIEKAYLTNKKFYAPFKKHYLGNYESMLCSGCAAKIGAADLQAAFLKLNLNFKKNDPRVIWEMADYEDVSAFNIPQSNLKIFQTSDLITSFNNNHYIFAKIATLHALNDILTKGLTGSFAHSFVTMPHADQVFHSEYLFHILKGITDTLNEYKIPLIAGHSSEGEILSLGLNITALDEGKSLLTKNSLAKSDMLILTKPLGSGLLIKANMLNIADGQDIYEMQNSQLTSHQPVLEICKQYNIQAATDISGFGLANHLGDMLKKSQKKANLFLEKIPIFSGVKKLLADKVRSSLHVRNQQTAFKMLALNQHQYNEKTDLLYDPQTAGPILMAVNKNNVLIILDALKSSGLSGAAIIGEVSTDSKNEKIINLV